MQVNTICVQVGDSTVYIEPQAGVPTRTAQEKLISLGACTVQIVASSAPCKQQQFRLLAIKPLSSNLAQHDRYS